MRLNPDNFVKGEDRGRRESVMKNLLFGTVIMMITVSPAFAAGNSYNSGEGGGGSKWSPSWRSPASSNTPPVVGSAYPVCHLVKERVGTRNGHVIYRTHEVCA
jgi:hypothetical protein